MLFNFLRFRGGPAAIELEKETFQNRRLILYYLDQKEAYAADLERRGPVAEWIVRGPFAMSRQDLRKLSAMNISAYGEPVFELRNQRDFRFKGGTPFQATQIITPRPIPTPKYTPAKKSPKKTPKPVATLVPTPEPFKPMNSDQQAINMAKGFAERGDNGDIIHTVQEPGETLEGIAKWYADAPGKGKDLATFNGIDAAAPLNIGARIRVPLRDVKNLKIMPPGYR